RIIESRGGEVRLGVAAARVEDRRVVLASGNAIECERVVLATPPERAAALVDDSFRARDPRWQAVRLVRHSPIVGVHLRFDRPVMGPPHAALVERDTQWVFTKDGARLHAVVSAADTWIDLPEGEIVRRVLEDVVACFPRARGATILAARSIKERRATFASTPAFERVR